LASLERGVAKCDVYFQTVGKSNSVKQDEHRSLVKRLLHSRSGKTTVTSTQELAKEIVRRAWTFTTLPRPQILFVLKNFVSSMPYPHMSIFLSSHSLTLVYPGIKITLTAYF
jgi:hypothetical protein